MRMSNSSLQGVFDPENVTILKTGWKRCTNGCSENISGTVRVVIATFFGVSVCSFNYDPFEYLFHRVQDQLLAGEEEDGEDDYGEDDGEDGAGAYDTVIIAA